MDIQSLISLDYELTGNGNWLHSEEHDSLVVDIRKQLFYWNSRGISGDAYVWLTKIKGMTPVEAKSFLKKNDTVSSYNFVSTVKNQEEIVVYPKLVDFFFEEGQRNDRSYWYERGITDRTIYRFRLGFHDGWYTIPFYQDGLFRNFQLRRDQPTRAMKSYYKGVGRLLFNSDILRISDTVFLTEGPTDCLRLVQEGWPALSHNAGSEGWDDSWSKYFPFQKEIVILYDNDKAGVTGAKKVANILGLYRCKIFCFWNMEDKYDIIDWYRDGYTSGELKERIKNESKYAFELG